MIHSASTAAASQALQLALYWQVALHKAAIYDEHHEMRLLKHPLFAYQQRFLLQKGHDTQHTGHLEQDNNWQSSMQMYKLSHPACMHHHGKQRTFSQPCTDCKHSNSARRSDGPQVTAFQMES